MTDSKPKPKSKPKTDTGESVFKKIKGIEKRLDDLEKLIGKPSASMSTTSKSEPATEVVNTPVPVGEPETKAEEVGGNISKIFLEKMEQIRENTVPGMEGSEEGDETE